MPRKKRKYEEYIQLGYRDDGSRIRKYIGADNKADFERLKYEARKEAELVRNPSTITFYDYASEFIKIFKATKETATQRQYNVMLNACKDLHNKPLASLTASDLQKVINSKIEHPRTCLEIRNFIKKIYDQAITDGIIPPFNLALRVSIPKQRKAEKRTISEAEMEIIDSTDLTDQQRLYIEVLKGTGMRPAEALALQWTDIHDLTITVSRSLGWNDDGSSRIKSTKTGAVRTIPISQELLDLISAAPRLGIFVFTVDGRPFSRSDYLNEYKKIMGRINKALGGNRRMNVLNGLNFYSFRHTYATQLYYRAVLPGHISTKKAAYIMGHQEQLFISTYTHLNDKFEDENAVREMFKKGDQRETKALKKVVGRPKGDQ